MISARTYLYIADNSGFDFLKCVKVFRPLRRNNVALGSYLLLSVPKGETLKKFANRKLCLGLLLTHFCFKKKPSGYYYRVGRTAVSVFTDYDKPIAGYIVGPIAIEAYLRNSSDIIGFVRVKL